MPRLFISYSRKDQDFAQRLATALAAMGADIWMDLEDIPAGMKWSSAIQQGLDSADLMIVILSPESMASRNVEDEWQYYLDNNKPIIPVLLRPAKIHFQLSRIQYIDFSRGDFDAALLRLHGELQRKGVALHQPPTLQYAGTLPATPSPQYHPPANPASLPQHSRTPQAGLIVGGLLALGVLVAVGVVIGILISSGSEADPTPTERTLLATNVAAQPTAAEATLLAATDPPPTPAQATPTNPPALPGLTAENPVYQNAQWSPALRRIDGVLMALVPTGMLWMGSSEEGMQYSITLCSVVFDRPSVCSGLVEDESPRAEITFERPFWIDVYEVTNGQYGSSGTFPGDDYPRTNVTWQQAQAHCETRGARLPTEAEWEYAARGPDGLEFPWGDPFDPATPMGNICDANCIYDWADGGYNDGIAHTDVVGSYPAGRSWVGAQDMAGNVWEWTSSLYWAYPYNPSDGRENPNDTTSQRTLRGSSWNWIAAEMRSASRAGHASGYASSDWYGFRCARDYVEGDLDNWPSE